MEKEHRVIIVGGGFGGIRCALDLAKNKPPHLKITLISDSSHFEYHAALYRVVTGRSPLEVCIPLDEIFKNKDIHVIKDKIVNVDLKEKRVIGEMDSVYKYESLVLALGSTTEYYNVPGLKEHSFGFKSINEALRLKKHLHEQIENCSITNKTGEKCATHIVVIGGGASGTEVAAELAIYAKKLAKGHKLDPSFITIDLIQADAHLVPLLPSEVSLKIEKRIRSLGVNVYLNSRLVQEDLENVYLNDMQIKAKTVIWTAGVTGNPILKNIEGLELNKRGQVIVDEFLQPKKQFGVFVIGDCAETAHSGMAQTAIRQGKYVSSRIKARLYQNNQELSKPYTHEVPVYIIPVGAGWAAYVDSARKHYGRVGWLFRRIFDFAVFQSILPLKKALLAFEEGRTLCETCEICVPKNVVPEISADKVSTII